MTQTQKEKIDQLKEKLINLKKKLKKENPKRYLTDFFENEILEKHNNISYSHFLNIMKGRGSDDWADVITVVDEYLREG